MLRGRTIAVGVSGGIAAYKACELVRALRARGAEVIVVMTRAAAEFVTPLTFQALSANPVVRDLWGDQDPGFRVSPDAAAKPRGAVEHVDVAEACDALVIAPATADLMARLVHGEAPDALTSVALALRAPLVVCPAMDREMWRHPATQANVRTLRARGATIVEPERGALASGLEGPGRLASLEAMVTAVEAAVARRASLAGVRVLVGAGRTEEPIDPVRVLSNRSSGRMGYAIAEAARDRGAAVTLVSGPASVPPPEGVALETVGTAEEMRAAMLAAAASADVVVMAAAVADYRPRRTSLRKLRREAKGLTLALEPTPDILAEIGRRRRRGQLLIGFALESENGLASARRKLREKGVDLMVLNAPREALGAETNRVAFVGARGVERLPRLTKREVAERLLDAALARRSQGGRPRATASRAGGVARATTTANGGARPAPGKARRVRVAALPRAPLRGAGRAKPGAARGER